MRRSASVLALGGPGEVRVAGESASALATHHPHPQGKITTVTGSTGAELTEGLLR